MNAKNNWKDFLNFDLKGIRQPLVDNTYTLEESLLILPTLPSVESLLACLDIPPRRSTGPTSSLRWKAFFFFSVNIKRIIQSFSSVQCFITWGRKEGNVWFNDTLNTFYLRLYGVRHMVKDHSDSEKGKVLPPYRLLFPINSKGSFICTIPHTG